MPVEIWYCGTVWIVLLPRVCWQPFNSVRLLTFRRPCSDCMGGHAWKSSLSRSFHELNGLHVLWISLSICEMSLNMCGGFLVMIFEGVVWWSGSGVGSEPHSAEAFEVPLYTECCVQKCLPGWKKKKKGKEKQLCIIEEEQGVLSLLWRRYSTFWQLSQMSTSFLVHVSGPGVKLRRCWKMQSLFSVYPHEP